MIYIPVVNTYLYLRYVQCIGYCTRTNQSLNLSLDNDTPPYILLKRKKKKKRENPFQKTVQMPYSKQPAMMEPPRPLLLPAELVH